MTPDNDPTAIAAERWYGQHRAEHLAHDCERMIDRCASHLMTHLPVTTAGARLAAMQALADIESAHAPGFIDIDRSTARMVVLRDSSNGTSHVLTLPELFWALNHRKQLQASHDAQLAG